MLRLSVNNKDVDLYESESVNLTLQFSDIQAINNPQGSFSQTFRVPATSHNLDIFGQVTKSNIVGGQNLKQRMPAELFNGTTPISSGFVQVKAMFLQKEEYADIQLVFFGGAVDLRSALSEKKLADLDLSSHDHILNVANLQNSWLGTGIGPEVRYGLIDKGFNWNAETNPPWTPTDGLWQGELTPYMQAKVILDAIMSEAGFTYDSTFFDATGEGNFGNMYMPLFNGSPSPSGQADENQTAGVAILSDITGPTSLVTLPLVDTAQDAYDPSDNWDNTPNQYTAPYTANYSVRISIPYTTTSQRVEAYLYKNGSSYATLLDTNLPSAPYIFNFTGDGIGSGINGPAILLETGDTLEVKYKLHGSNAKILGMNNPPYGGVNSPVVTASMEVYEVPAPLSGQTISISANMPDMKQIDFVLGLQKMFNLVFIPDKLKPSHLNIEPFQTYMSTGSQKDWSSLVDYSMDLQLEPTTDIQAERYEWTYAPGQDFVSQAIQQQQSRVYGRYEVTEPENDFATGENVVQTPFGQYMLTNIPGAGFPIHRALTSGGQIITKPLPMLSYWCGLSVQFGPWYLRIDDGTTTAVSGDVFPFFSVYSKDLPSVEDKSLLFGTEAPFTQIVASPANTLYFQYWAQYVAELYSDEARLLTCSVRLSRAELFDVDFNDKIFIKDDLYRILRISYDANVEGLAKVEFIKVLADVGLCADTPTSYAADKITHILFNNSTAASRDFGSQACCELYGYSWEKNTQPIGGVTPANLCRPPQITQPPT